MDYRWLPWLIIIEAMLIGFLVLIFNEPSTPKVVPDSCVGIEKEMHIMNHNFDILLTEVKKNGSLKKERKS